MVANFGLKGRVIAVTGGASGIGLAIVRRAVQEGAAVAIVDVSKPAADQVADELSAEWGTALAVGADVRDSAACENAMRVVEETLGPIDGVVAAAGISRPALAAAMDDQAWLGTLDVNLNGLFWTLRAAGQRMLSRGGGAIVAVASVDGLGGHAARASYSASKHGVIGLVRSLAIEWGHRGVRVNAIAPGPVNTPFVERNVPSDHLEGAMLDRTPLARFSQAADQAGPALFLLSDDAAYISGAVLNVDGGLTAGWFTRWNGTDLGSNKLLADGAYSLREQPDS